MKILLALFALSALLLVGCEQKKVAASKPLATKSVAKSSTEIFDSIRESRYNEVIEPDKFSDTISGNFTGRGKSRIWFERHNNYAEAFNDDIGGDVVCTYNMKSSDKSIPKIRVFEYGDVVGVLNVGDINHDGRDDVEVTFNETGVASWVAYVIMSLQEGKWHYILKPTFLRMGAEHLKVKTDKRDKSKFIMTLRVYGLQSYDTLTTLRVKIGTSPQEQVDKAMSDNGLI